jgi:hypothetical protein
MKTFTASIALALLLSALSCQTENTPAGLDGWLKGDTAEKMETIARQLRGFDVAMAETGYRYVELYWAGQDENWGYAAYQAEKIRLAIQQGLERRPKRAASAEHFLQAALPELEQAVRAQDRMLFDQNFRALTASCNACHAMEKVPFFNVQPPQARQSPIYGSGSPKPEQ